MPKGKKDEKEEKKMRKYMHENELKTIAENIAETVTIRRYDGHHSKDITRKPTKRERELIMKTAYSALLTLNWGEANRSDRHAEQAIIDNAEFMIDQLIDGVNGFMTIYCPLKKAVGEWEEA